MKELYDSDASRDRLIPESGRNLVVPADSNLLSAAWLKKFLFQIA
jgi:hypothetical protein